MNEKDCLILEALYSEHSLTRAAKRLYTSQPAVTRRVQQMEQELGCPLLVRGTRGVEFSPQGALVAQWACRNLEELRRVRDQIQNMDSGARGVLRMACSNVYAKFRLPRLLRAFRDSYPNVEVKVRTGVSQQVHRVLLQGEVHLSILRGEYRWAGIRKPLGEDRYYAASAFPFELEDLPGLPQIRYSTDGQLQNEIDAWWFSQFDRPPRIAMEVDSADTCLYMAREGLGYAILSELSLESSPQLCRQALIFGDGTALKRQSSLCYRQEVLEIPPARIFIEFMESFSF